jgi:hypothetical protein
MERRGRERGRDRGEGEKGERENERDNFWLGNYKSNLRTSLCFRYFHISMYF